MSAGQQVLLDAADLIEEKGWIQGANWRPGLGYCVFGAINKVTQNDLAFSDAVGRVLTEIGRLNQPWTGGIARWNDEPGRTKDEVLAALRKAAES